MKVLLINKFLHPAGGAETYVFEVGDALRAAGHEVQYFGMEHPGRIRGNARELYTSQVDFGPGFSPRKLTYPFRIIYSAEAERKLTEVLRDFCPDVIHFNNFNYQLTPSTLAAAERWKREHPQVKLILTAHDYQLLCPNHLLYRPLQREVCVRCLDGQYLHCVEGRCIHGSAAQSVLGAFESWYWHRRGIYRCFDRIICPSRFLKSLLDRDPLLAGKTEVVHNFIRQPSRRDYTPRDYVLYFGRFAPEKGLDLLLQVCGELPEIPFVFAGEGPLADHLQGLPNVKNVGFQSGEKLERLIGEARFSVCPSVCYENYPYAALESISLGTPVVGAKIGGIPEILKEQRGLLFPSGDPCALREAVRKLWTDENLLRSCRRSCAQAVFLSRSEYCRKLTDLYRC